MSGRSDFQAWLSATAGRRRRAALWRGAAAGAAAIAAALALAAGADRLLAPSGWALVALAAVSLALAASLTGVILWRASSRDAAARVAALADAEQPAFEDRVKTAIDLVQRPEPGMFDDLVLAQTTRQVAAADLPITNDVAGARRGMRLAAGAAVALAIAIAAAWPTLRDAGTTAGILLFPESMQLLVEPGDARVPIGKTMTITARAARLPRTFGRDLPVLTIHTGGRAASGEMPAADGSFAYITPPITQSFTYRVAFGTALSREYRVEALPYPNVERIDLSYRYPSWSGLPPREEQDAGDVYGPEGTEVRLQVRFDKPARAAALVMGDGTRVPLAPSHGGTFETRMTLATDSSYRVEVTDTDGLTAGDATEYFIRLMDDAPPDVRIVRPSGDQRVTPLAEVAVEAVADDDHGVRSLELVYAVRGQDERVVPIGGAPGRGRTARGRHLIYLEDLGVKPGDFVSFHARARDVARGRQSTEGRSDIFFLEVKPFEEEFAAAQSMAQAGAGAASRQLQGLAAAQKEIIVATWKLERRSGAGRSRDDLRAVAQAQRELRQRTAQAAGRAGAPSVQASRRGRRGGTAPPQPAAAAPEEASPAVLLARAGEAMERATAEIDGGRLKPALDHEHTALNELLRIEAQVRRREIMQAQNQAAGGGGGGQNGNQDLSALFDRELQRQQQTNYENRANARAGEQQQRQEQESDALRRVREMAQRQEALRRQQEELARANVTADERRRQLERLRRDQEQLQRQVEQLARQLDQQQGQRGQQGQQAQQGQAGQSGQAGAASQAMSQAAGSLGRDDLEGAGQQSARAADALRALEREMREREQGAQSRAMNDARMEAQQLAEAQRRLAEDAARVARDGAGADAARRVAAEKERLAERLDALGRRLDAGRQARPERQGSQAGRGSGSSQADQTARDAAAASRRLAREQRDGAGDWAREGTQGSQRAPASPGAARLAEGERQMAADLERLARRLGAPPSGAGEADARRLANDLDEARAARERLADLERQIDDLRRQAESGQRGEGDSAARRLDGLQREFGREAQRARELASRRPGNQQNDGRGATPEEAWSPSRSAPGTQQWKQDFSKWESMRKDVAQALESYEASLTAKLAEQLASERVHAGYDARTPEAWRKLVADYYEAIARRRNR